MKLTVLGKMLGFTPVSNLLRGIRRSLPYGLLDDRPMISEKFEIPCGKHTYGPKPRLVGHEWLAKGTRIGSFCSLSPGVVFLFLGKHRYDWVTAYPFYEFYDVWRIDANHYTRGKIDITDSDPAPIIVGNDVWIASDACIKQGVNVGDGAVIAMKSMVTRDVPPYAIVGGNPARVIKYWFSAKQIEALLRMEWWNWPDDEIIDMLPMLLSSGVDRFIKMAEERH